MITISAGDYALTLAPERGGAILRFDWKGQAVMRPACGPSILDTACFPLVPFSNRIAHGQFVADGRKHRLAPNFPGSDHPHPLHGFGWLAEWKMIDRSATSAKLEHRHGGGDWPWLYRAEQCINLDDEGLLLGLAITNEGDSPMPTGLGFHPYFPRNSETFYRGLHRGEWTTSSEGLPISEDLRDAAIDWWEGLPADRRIVDTVYSGREGPLSIAWNDRELHLCMTPSPLLGTTVVYTPANAPFFCVEPVSHPTDAINRAPEALTILAPGETVEASIAFTAGRIRR